MVLSRQTMEERLRDSCTGLWLSILPYNLYCIIKFCYSNIIQKLGLLKSVLRCCQQKLGAKIKCRTITQIITKYLSLFNSKTVYSSKGLCYYRVGNISINEIWIHIGIYLVEAFCHLFTQFPCRKRKKKATSRFFLLITSLNTTTQLLSIVESILIKMIEQ